MARHLQEFGEFKPTCECRCKDVEKFAEILDVAISSWKNRGVGHWIIVHQAATENDAIHDSKSDAFINLNNRISPLAPLCKTV